MEDHDRTPRDDQSSSSDHATEAPTGPRGPVPAPCPQGGIPRPAPQPPQYQRESGNEPGSRQTRFTGTYSPDDNKLRLYASRRLDVETYARVKATGFIWAPKQDLFVAPTWSPQREDLLIELAGQIDDEDTSLVERAEVRSDRFEGYSERRGTEAESARAAVASIADNIPFGQPILVGHHSERHARRDAERIQNGMRRAVKLWETSTYWISRAAGAVRHAKYKERPDVRARRIKTIEAEQRKFQREIAECEHKGGGWAKLTDPQSITRNGEPITFAERVRFLAGRGIGCRYELAQELDEGKVTPEQAQANVVASFERRKAHVQRWVAHCDNRLAYERAMLDASGYVPPPKPKTKADLPLLNYSGAVAYRNPYRTGEIVRTVAVPMTKAELATMPSDYKGTRMSECGTHRLRYALVGRGKPGYGGDYGIIVLTDSKQHPRPDAAVVAKAASAAEQALEEGAADQLEVAIRRTALQAPAKAAARAAAAPFEVLRESLKTGVTVVVAPQLFPTPAELARRMVAAAGGCMAGKRVLEPSAGTGNLVRAIAASATGFDSGVKVVAVEVNPSLAEGLRIQRQKTVYATEENFDVREADFLDCNGDLGKFDRIVMNPPFARGADVAHIKHALTFLKPGGRLVAVCADGERQRAALAHLAATWEPLPADTFKDQGTSVRTALLVVEARS
jgi:predicted RNA methylase